MITADPMVSVYCVTYNHEKYITQALDSILMQKTQYSMEVLVGEDCSTDNTRAILKGYESCHFGKIQVFYRQHNMGAMENSRDLLTRCKGKYVICLECDDFWIDEHKIEKQVNFLEKHPEYIAVAHNCLVVGDDSNPINEEYCECKETEYTLEKHYLWGILPGHTATIMSRNYAHGEIFDTTFVDSNMLPGDRRLCFSLAVHGRVYCMQDVMTAYRHVWTSGSSFSATYKHNYHDTLQWYFEQLQYAYKINNLRAIMCAEVMYLLIIKHGLEDREISVSRAIRDMAPILDKRRAFKNLIIRDIKKHIWL